MCVHRISVNGITRNAAQVAAKEVKQAVPSAAKAISSVAKNVANDGFRCLADEEPTLLQMAIGLARRGLFKLGQIAQNIKI